MNFKMYIIIENYKGLTVQRLLVNIICLFVPFRKLRRKIRKYLERLPKVKNNKYQCIFSVGSACFIATALENAGLRNFSGPFDWMYGSTLSQRFEIFIKKFAHFFDKQDLKYIGPDIKGDAYKNNRTGLTFNHDFAIGSDFNTTYPSVKAKYDRRIKRVVDLISGGAKTLIVYAESVGEKSISNAKLSEMLKSANNSYKTKNINFLYIKNNKKLKKSEYIDVKQVNENLFVAEYNGWIQNDRDNVRLANKFINKCLHKVMNI